MSDFVSLCTFAGLDAAAAAAIMHEIVRVAKGGFAARTGDGFYLTYRSYMLCLVPIVTKRRKIDHCLHYPSTFYKSLQ